MDEMLSIFPAAQPVQLATGLARHSPLAPDEEPPRLRDVGSRVFDADACGAANLARGEPLRRVNRQRRISEIGAVQAAVDRERTTEVAGSSGETEVGCGFYEPAALAHRGRAVD